MLWDFWLILFFLWPSLVAPCNLDTAYITLGGRWSTAEEETLYVVGIGSPTYCNPRLIQLNLVTQHHRQVVKPSALSRSYVSSDTTVRRFFYFFNITATEVQDSECHFNYQIRHREKSSRIFKFRSLLFCKRFFATYFLGQHDHSVVGLRATENLLNENFELLILSGNHATFFHSDRCAEGERYLKTIEPLVTKKPVLVMPGIRESKEDFAAFNFRFWMPFTNNSPYWDYFLITIRKKDFLFLNLQKHVQQTFTANKRPEEAEDRKIASALGLEQEDLQQQLEMYPQGKDGDSSASALESKQTRQVSVLAATKLKSMLELGEEDSLDNEDGSPVIEASDPPPSPETVPLFTRLSEHLARRYHDPHGSQHFWKVLVTNVAFYCSNEDDGDTCINNLYLLKDFDDLFDFYRFQLNINSARKIFESTRNVFNFKRSAERNRNYVTAGMAGCSSFWSGDAVVPSQLASEAFNDRQAVLSLQLFSSYYKIDVLGVPDMLTTKLIFLSKNVWRVQYFALGMVAAFLILVFLVQEFVNVEDFKDQLARFRLPKGRKNDDDVQIG